MTRHKVNIIYNQREKRFPLNLIDSYNNINQRVCRSQVCRTFPPWETTPVDHIHFKFCIAQKWFCVFKKSVYITLQCRSHVELYPGCYHKQIKIFLKIRRKRNWGGLNKSLQCYVHNTNLFKPTILYYVIIPDKNWELKNAYLYYYENSTLI